MFNQTQPYWDISTHALTWRATFAPAFAPCKALFLPTPSHGGRRVLRRFWSSSPNFYPRPHMEGDEQDGSSCNYYWNFYPRPHMEGDCARLYWSGVAKSYFYPRPHMEGDASSFRRHQSHIRISTHALTWRATQVKTVGSCLQIFLPTPSHGGRQSPDL